MRFLGSRLGSLAGESLRALSDLFGAALLRWRWRWLVPIVFIILTGVAVVLAVEIADTTWQQILAGVATTTLAAGVVDLVAMVERWRDLRPVRQVVGRRIGCQLQQLVEIVTTVFDDVDASDPWRLPERLRCLPDQSVDFDDYLTHLCPSVTRRQHLTWLLEKFDETASEIASLSITGALAEETNRLEAAPSSFLNAVKATLAANGSWGNRFVNAGWAADLLECYQEVQPAAKVAAGKTWRFGSVPSKKSLNSRVRSSKRIDR